MSRLRRWWRALGQQAPAVLREPFAREHLSLELPGPGGRGPLLKIELQQTRSPEADGERLHLRARVQTHFASALRPMLSAAAAAPSSERGLVPRAATGGRALVQRALEVPLVRNLAEAALQYDFNTFIDLQASTASLAQGSGALVPAPEQLAALGITPDLSPNAPPVQSWAGERGGSQALISLLRIDPEQWPEGLKAALGGAALSLAATIVHTAEPARRDL